MGNPDPWPYGRESAAILIASVSWPWERRENRDAWAPKMLDNAELAEQQIARARAHLNAAINALRDD